MSTEKPNLAADVLARIRLGQEVSATEQMAHAIMASPTMMELVAECAEADLLAALQRDPDDPGRRFAQGNSRGFRLQATVASVAIVAISMRQMIARQAAAPQTPSPLAAALAKWSPAGEPQ